MSRRVLITGGAGFIGSNLAKELVKNHEVTVLDNFHTGSVENLKLLLSNIEIIQNSCEKILSLKLPRQDLILHLGIPSSSPMYKRNPCLVGEAIGDAISVFEFAKKDKVEKVIYASSSSIYSGLPLPFKEDMTPKVTDFYTEARICVERLARLYYQLYGVKSVGLRLFSVYGPGERLKGKYANVISQMLLNDEFTIYGEGDQTRDFVHVDDVARAFLLAMNHKRLECEIINIGTGRETSFNELAGIISSLKPLRIKYQPNPIPNYVHHLKADIVLAREKLDWEPKVGLEEGIKSLNQYYAHRLISTDIF